MNFGIALPVTIFCIWLALFSRIQVALLVVAFSSLIGTYVLNEDLGRSLLPGPIVATAFIARYLFRRLVRVEPGVGQFPGRVWLVSLFSYAALITLTVPWLMGGAIEVVRPGLLSEGFRFAVPLDFSISNIAQLAYLAVATGLVFVAVHATKIDGMFSEGYSRKLVTISCWIGVVIIVDLGLNLILGRVDIFGFLMGEVLGEYRPDRYALEGIFGFPLRRAQGVFGEPSYFSAFMSGTAAASFIYMRSTRKIKDKLIFLIIFSSLLLSFSTTAYISAAIVLIVVAFAPMTRRDRVSRGGRGVAFLSVLLLSALVVGLLVSSQTLSSYVFGKFSDTDGFESGNFSSGAERLYWDVTALRAFFESWGLGVGVGSIRASSAFINVAATMGLFGASLFLVIIALVLRRIFGREEVELSVGKQAVAAMLFGWLVAFSISVPDIISFFYFSIGLGVFLGAGFSEKRRLDIPVATSP
ncbi:hypothetical protein [Chromobacterium haemolyticum]|uniref:hypothetical protein n=1 Tax=Chromobacterium TaxID=535 RepID=UPI000A4B4CD4|nr:hypothetical protein [Chromobacterium haemolyticum]